MSYGALLLRRLNAALGYMGLGFYRLGKVSGFRDVGSSGLGSQVLALLKISNRVPDSPCGIVL